jgi:TrmH family RNA methyltransferase
MGRFLVEGTRELGRALAAGVRVHELYVCEALLPPGEQARECIGQARRAGAEILSCARGAFEKASLREGPDGLLAVAECWETALASLELSASPLLLVAEAVEKPGNLGALLRTADAAGADAVICCDGVVDLFNPNVVRASQGLVFSVPVVVASSEAVAGFCRERGIALLATTPYSEKDYWDCDLARPAAIALGSEKDGLGESLLTLAHERVRIPMAGRADSLNVSAAAAVVLFEAARQRQAVHRRGPARGGS